MEYYSGRIWSEDPFIGYIGVEDGILKEMGSGEPPEPPVHIGEISAAVIDGHTHIGDAGLVLDRKYTLEELVAPPNGLKHRYLRSTSRDEVMVNMRDYADALCGPVTHFIDFREGGVEGVRMLRDVSDKAVILGRPISPEFDPNEVDGILDVADGLGISSISDMSLRYIEALADAAHRKGKIFAIHASERIREDIDSVLSLEPDFIVHMCESTDMDMRKCADADVPVVVCATSNMYFGKVPPIARFVESGVALSIGTDNAMLCPPDIFKETSAFSMIAREQGCPSDVPYRALFTGGCKCLITRSRIGMNIGAPVVPCVFDHDPIRTA